MTNKLDKVLVVVIIFTVLSICGMFSIYAHHYHAYANAERDGDYAYFTIDTNIHIEYTAISIDNSSNKTTKVAAFYDDNYSSCYSVVDLKESLEWLSHSS